MNAFEEPFWNLDQLLAWMISRAPEAVQFARIGNVSRDTKTSRLIRRFAELAALRAAKKSRNIEEELWAASGLDPESYQKTRSFYSPSPKERALRGFCEKRPLETELFMEEALTRIGRARLMIRGLDRVEPERLRSLLKDVFADNAVQEPPREVVVSLFPYLDYLLRLFRKGALVASGNLPGKRALEISLAEWAGLEIAEGDNTHRLGVWRVGRTANVKHGADRLILSTGLYPGAGDIENVCVQRDGILKEFPERTPRTQTPQEVKPLSDDAARELIWEAASKKHGFITQNEGEIILRTRDPSMKRDDARGIVKSVIGNEKRGPRGPRNNSAK